MKKHTRRELESMIKKYGVLYRSLGLSDRARLADHLHLGDTRRAAGVLFASVGNFSGKGSKPRSTGAQGGRKK